jgi:hypothetical protein
MNRVHIAIAIAISTAALLAVGNAQTNRTPVGQPGRYQLFVGEHDVLGSGAAEKVTLRIDTATGEVSEYMTGKDRDGATVDDWLPTGLLPLKPTKR